MRKRMDGQGNDGKRREVVEQSRDAGKKGGDKVRKGHKGHDWGQHSGVNE